MIDAARQGNGLGGCHVLVAGCTGSGKGSVLWSWVRALAPAVRTGLAEPWACDPKSGMELAPGAALFTRFAYTPQRMVELLEDAATVMLAQGDWLRRPPAAAPPPSRSRPWWSSWTSWPS